MRVCHGLSVEPRWRTKMPLFLLPYFYMQLVMTSGTSLWTMPVSTNPDEFGACHDPAKGRLTLLQVLPRSKRV